MKESNCIKAVKANMIEYLDYIFASTTGKNIENQEDYISLAKNLIAGLEDNVEHDMNAPTTAEAGRLVYYLIQIKIAFGIKTISTKHNKLDMFANAMVAASYGSEHICKGIDLIEIPKQ